MTDAARVVNYQILLVYWNVSNPNLRRERKNGWLKCINIWEWLSYIIILLEKNCPNCILGSHIVDSGCLPKDDCLLRLKRKPILKLFSKLIWFALFQVFCLAISPPNTSVYLLWSTGSYSIISLGSNICFRFDEPYFSWEILIYIAISR